MEHKTASGYLHEEHGTFSSGQILHPTAFHFKEGRVLAAHPPSCHPRRVFGYPENGKENKRKGEKVEQRREKAGELKSSPCQFFID